MKKLRRVILVVLAVLVLLVVVLTVALGPIVRQAVNTVGPRLAGVPVHLDHVSIAPLRGIIRLKGLTVGNPPGFKSPHLLDLGELTVRIDLRSLASDIVHVREIRIQAPKVWYERGISGSNLGALQAQLEKPEAAEPAAEQPAPSGGRKVVIDRVSVTGGRVGIRMGVGAEVPLPTIELRDIGKDDPSGGAEWTAAARRIAGAILGGVAQALTQAGIAIGDLLGSGVKTLGRGVAEGGKLAGEGLNTLGEVGSGASKAVGEAGKAAGAALEKGLGGLLGTGRRNDKPSESDAPGE